MATQPNYRGALTHYLCHPESFTYKLPDNMDTMEGALVEACRSRDACRDAGRC